MVTMKLIKAIGHPIVLICIYLLLVIEGDNFGGFYLLYLVLALPHAVLYSIIAAIGIGFIVVGFNLQGTHRLIQKSALYLLGYVLMMISLVVFFAKGNKWSTFELTMPLLSFILLGLCSICFIISTLYMLWLSMHPKVKSQQVT